MAKRIKKNFVKKPTLRFRVNEQIRIPEIRLVGDNMAKISEAIGQNIESGIYPTRRVQEWAQRMDLDLVEISPKAKPPVCQIIDYKKFLYNKRKREKEIKAKAVKTVIKEIRFGPNIGENDFNFKLKHASGFLQDGAKVKAYVHFRGRTIVFRDRGELVLLNFIKGLAEFGTPEALPKMEGRRMIVVIAPKKSAIKKKAKEKADAQKDKRPPRVEKSSSENKEAENKQPEEIKNDKE